jgi:hypothetical protein
MRQDVPAWPPGASRSTTKVRKPSDAPYRRHEPRRSAADDYGVVFSKISVSCLEAEALGKLASRAGWDRSVGQL